MSSFAVCVKLLSGSLIEVCLAEGSLCVDLVNALRSIPDVELPSAEDAELQIYLDNEVRPYEPIRVGETYFLFIHPIEWHVLFPQTVNLARHFEWNIYSISLKNGTLALLEREDHTTHQLVRGPAIRYLYDNGGFAELIDHVNPWDYSLDFAGIESFIHDHIITSEEDVMEPINDYPSLYEHYKDQLRQHSIL